LQAFGTDNQAAKAAEDYRRGQANPVGASAAPVSEAPKSSLRRAVKQNGTAWRIKGRQSLRDYRRTDVFCVFCTLSVLPFGIYHLNYPFLFRGILNWLISMMFLKIPL